MTTAAVVLPHVGDVALVCAVTEIEGSDELELRTWHYSDAATARARLRQAGFRCRPIVGGEGSSFSFRVAGVDA